MWGAAIWCTLDTEHHPASSWTLGSVWIVHGERENCETWKLDVENIYFVAVLNCTTLI